MGYVVLLLTVKNARKSIIKLQYLIINKTFRINALIVKLDIQSIN